MTSDQNPFGNKKSNPSFDLADMGKKIFMKKKSSPDDEDVLNIFRILAVGVGVIILFWALLGIFIVAPAEKGVVLKFGRYFSTVGPGPHWIPRLIERAYVLNVQQISTYPYQAEMLTEDENIVSVALAVQYRIANPQDFLFKVVDPVHTLKQATSSALRQAVGQITLNDVLTTGREKLRDDVAKQLKLTLKIYNTGLQVMDVALQATKPPNPVIEAFNDAIKAREDSQRYINQAQAYSRRILLSAKGKVARLQNDADAYRQSVVLEAKGNVARYNAFLTPYKKAPKVTAKRLYLDTVGDVLSHTTNIIVEGSNNLLYLPLNQMIKKHIKAMENQAVPATPSKPNGL